MRSFPNRIAAVALMCLLFTTPRAALAGPANAKHVAKDAQLFVHLLSELSIGQEQFSRYQALGEQGKHENTKTGSRQTGGQPVESPRTIDDPYQMSP